MKRIAVILMSLVVVLGATAEPVSSQQAASAVRAWVARQDTFGVPLGETAYDTKTLTMTNGVSYHAVRMLGGGTVITSGDTEDEPIVAFTSETVDLSTLDRRNPLWTLLDRTAIGKRKTSGYVVRQAAAAPLATKAAAAVALDASKRSRSATKWAALLEEAEATSTPLKRLAATAAGSDSWLQKPFRAATISDVRVWPLVQSKWSQSTDKSGGACYNYYTPNHYDYDNEKIIYEHGNPDNIVCGCVATATAQVMRYHEWPQDEVTPRSGICTWNETMGIPVTMRGGIYQWDLMDYNPTSPSTETRQEIGKLLFDIDVALGVTYNMKNKGMTGASSGSVGRALVDDFGYGSATHYWDSKLISGETDPANFDEKRAQALQRLFYANFDAGLPVVVDIQPTAEGGAGHEVVADGYGYSADGLDYVHMNFGWAGSCDYWFLLPIVSYEGGGDGVTAPSGSMIFSGAIYNIFPTFGNNCAVMSGRVLNDEDKVVSGVAVVVRKQGEEEPVATVYTSSKGVWGLVVTGGTYEVSSEYDGIAKTLTVPVETPRSGFSEPEDIGNSWGNDFELYRLCVRNLRTGDEYRDFDRAIAAAEANDTLEVFDVGKLKRPTTIDRNLTILCPSETPEALAVICRAGAGLTVLDGCELFLSNVVFAAENALEIQVAANASVALAGKISLGKIVTADTRGIRLAGALTEDTFVDVDCAAAPNDGDVFGTWPCDQATAEAWAAHLLNPHDADIGGIAMSDGSLRWGVVPVHPLRAFASFTDGSGTSSYYMKLYNLFSEHPEDGRVTILRDGRLEGFAPVRGEKRFVCTNETPAVVTYYAWSNSVVCVESGAKLTVSNLVITGASPEGAFVVKGGELTLDDGTLIDGFSNEKGDGVVTVSCDSDWKPGKLTMLTGSVISNCTTVGYGGGVCVGRPDDYIFGSPVGCSLDLFGGKVYSCTAGMFGGGVFVSQYSKVRVMGDAVVSNNTSTASGEFKYGLPDDVAMHGQADEMSIETNLVLVGELTGRISVYQLYEGGLKDEPFGVVADTCSVEAASNSAVRIWCDARNEGDALLHARYDAESGKLVWDDSKIFIQEPEPDYPVAWVIAEVGGQVRTNAYASLDAAFAAVDGDAIVEINDVVYPLTDATFTADEAAAARHTNSVAYLGRDVAITGDVVVRTRAGGRDVTNCICRADEVTVTVRDGGRLTLTNVCLLGIFPQFKYDAEKHLMDLSWWSNSHTAMVRVESGGELVMDDRSSVRDMPYAGGSLFASRDAVAVSVDEGTFTMRAGAEITDCFCTYNQEPGQEAPAGGVLVDGANGRFYLDGGRISRCGGVRGGGVFVDNDATIFVSGSPVIEGNSLAQSAGDHLSELSANLSVAHEVDGAHNGEIVLIGPFTGSIGYLEPRLYDSDQRIETNEFGRVAEGIDPVTMRSSAAHFHRDAAPGVTGLVVTNGTEALLVWSSAVQDGVYTKRDVDGNIIGVYDVVAADPASPSQIVYADPTPIVIKEISRVSETEVSLVVADRVRGAKYRLLWTESLSKGFTSTSDWVQATQDGAWQTNILFAAPMPASLFWKAEAARDIVPKN